MSLHSKPPPVNVFDDDDDDEGWQEMPVVREDTFLSGLNEEDQKKYHYVPPAHAKAKSTTNATGNILDVDDFGNEWRTKADQNENEYTRLRMNEEDESDEVHLRTKYLFDEDKAMTPLSQMQATKNLLTEAQRIAYVGLCALTSREMSEKLKTTKRKELKAAAVSLDLWALKIMGRLYYHMELETQEQKMIESLAIHGVQAVDLVPALMTTHTVANPEYDPEEAKRQAAERKNEPVDGDDSYDEASMSRQTLVPDTPASPPSTSKSSATITSSTSTSSAKTFQTTARVLEDTTTSHMPGVTTALSSADKDVTLDIRWTVLCDLFLILIADSVYDARSRVLLESVALKLGLGWLDVVKFESRVTEALEIQEDVEKMENQQIVEGRRKAGKRRRYVMMGLATLGGGLVIGLSAGLLAPVIGAGLGAALTAVGISGTTGFLAGAGGAAVITTGGVLTGSGIAVKGMARRTQQVRVFDILPLHNNKRVNCILTVPGFMTSIQDDVRLPFSVLDPIVGDVFSVLWEPEMIRETGDALRILTREVLTQIGQTVLSVTAMTALMSALQWPIILTKLGYLIDNPWSNALDRAKGAGKVLADVLLQRNLGVRPITLIGFSLGSRVIFYALVELARQKAYGIVQDVFIMGTTVTASQRTWLDIRSVVSGRFVNAYARNDWVLNYLFRATSGGVGTVAGLRPIENVPGLENVDVTDKISGHMSYRTFMPLILDQLGFPVSADYFDEPEEPDFTEDRIVVREGDVQEKKGWFSRKQSNPTSPTHVSRPPTASHYPRLSQKLASGGSQGRQSQDSTQDDAEDLPPRLPTSQSTSRPHSPSTASTSQPPESPDAASVSTPLPARAGFDFAAIKEVLAQAQPDGLNGNGASLVTPPDLGGSRTPTMRTASIPSAPSALHSRSAVEDVDRLAGAVVQSMTLQHDNDDRRRYSDDEDDDEELSPKRPQPTLSFSNDYSSYPNASPFAQGTTAMEPTSNLGTYQRTPSHTIASTPSLEYSSSPWTPPSFSTSPNTSAAPHSSQISSYAYGFGNDLSSPFSASEPPIDSNATQSPSSASPYSYASSTGGADIGLGFGGGLGGMGLNSDFGKGPTMNSFPSFAPPNAGLSFGSLDGTITMGAEAMPSSSKSADGWKIPDHIGRKTSGNGGGSGTAGLGSNPWS